MKVLHISTECYPAAKAGGLGDVVGALPKYQRDAGVDAAVILPKYQTKWLVAQEYDPVFRGFFNLSDERIPFSIEKQRGDTLGFPLYVTNIPGKFDRPGVYADTLGQVYEDELERYLSFQCAILEWIVSSSDRPDLLHCHDYHTGFIPFFVNHSIRYGSLHQIPTVFTIHNGEYHGTFGWERLYLLPDSPIDRRGFLDYNNAINPLATAIKTCWALTTVSPGYMDELRQFSNGLEPLLRQEAAKSAGILNGIDTRVWDPATDHYLVLNLKRNVEEFKRINKRALMHKFRVNLELPLVTFIGRLVREKGADIIPDLIRLYLSNYQDLAFIVLGTGEPYLHDLFLELKVEFPENFDVALEYNEGLAHNLYAGSDFLLMPSRVEPCGLNQMYAMRYGTVPIVRSVGGLRDSVIDIGDPDGTGIRFDHFNVHEAFHALKRAADLYADQAAFAAVRKSIMKVDFSWERSAAKYIEIYESLLAKT